MSVKRVTPNEALALVEQGWTYVDVRSIPEFEQGHPRGAYNVPLLHKGAAGMVQNSRFVEVMRATFDLGDKLLLGCRSGNRSLRAAEALAAAGFSALIDVRGGFDGERDAAGSVVVEGWSARGLPVATEAETGRSYQDLEP
jgi:rhodanese-related sulfurtransferase